MCFRSRIKANAHKHSGSSSRCLLHYSILLYALLLVQQQTHVQAAAGRVAKGLGRMRAAKIASIHGLQVAAESLPSTTAKSAVVKDKAQQQTSSQLAGKYEIRSVSGEPNYKSVNLTWEVEFVPATSSSSSSAETVGDAVTNSSAEVEPPKAFQIFFCELQSFGPHRCRSKLVNSSQQLEPNNELELEAQQQHRQMRHYTVEIDNLRMATKYSFHIRPQAKRSNMKITGRSEIFGNEIEDELTLNANNNGIGQTIVIPTKGFSAQATKCLPNASEIEVETGPYFGGKIVVDGGNCGVKGNPDDATDKYTMRIDHKMCGSLVKPETNTVETFITVQENLGIFTHSTRRFVVVCSFQSGMQTVRASFTVPGKDGIAAAVENDPFEPDERLGREQRHMRYVDKSALVLKEHLASNVELAPNVSSEESEAMVQEVADPMAHVNQTLAAVSAGDAANAVAVLEDIIPGVNERDIKHENEVLKPAEAKQTPIAPAAQARLAKYAKLVSEQATLDVEDDVDELQNAADTRYTDENRAFASSLHYISANAGSVVLTVSLSVIVLGVFIFIVYREARRQRFIRNNIRMEQLHSAASSAASSPTLRSNAKRTMPRALQSQHPQGIM